MTNNNDMPDVIYVSEYDRDINFDSEDDANLIAGKGKNTKYIRADLVKPKPIEGLDDAISIQDIPTPRTHRDFKNILKRHKDHRDIYGVDASETIEEAARAYRDLCKGG